MLIVIFLVGCSINQTTNNKKTRCYKRFEDAPLIDQYRLKAAYEIHKNWKTPVNSKTSNSNRIVSIAFKIMPNGLIKDIFIVKNSGEDSFDMAAIDAIKRTSPLKPHPKGLTKSYVEMGLRFTDQGVR
jgi:TonB family protein